MWGRHDRSSQKSRSRSTGLSPLAGLVNTLKMKRWKPCVMKRRLEGPIPWGYVRDILSWTSSLAKFVWDLCIRLWFLMMRDLLSLTIHQTSGNLSNWHQSIRNNAVQWQNRSFSLRFQGGRLFEGFTCRGVLSKLHIVPKFVLPTRSTSKSLTPFVVLAKRRCVNSRGRKQRLIRPPQQLRLHRPRQRIRSWRSESIKVCCSCFFQWNPFDFVLPVCFHV